MSRINTNVSALIAQRNLAKSQTELATSLERLSTGLRINSGADDPAGLIVSQRLSNEIAGVNQAMTNIQQASNVAATTEGGLQEISNLLVSITSLITEAANTGAFSPDEVQANQMQIDSAIDSINRIAATTSFAGLKLLNGSMDYITSGITGSQMTDVHVLGANFGTNTTIPVNVAVVNSAQHGHLFLSAASGKILSAVTLQIAGTEGSQAFQFASGTPLSAVAYAVNSVKDALGVSASLVSATNQTSGLNFDTTAYGSHSFVSVKALTGGTAIQTYDAKGGTSMNRNLGQDVVALVNGNVALGDGLQVSLRTDQLSLEFVLTSGAAQVAGTNYDFTITGGGATYQIGPSVNSQQQVGFGIQSVSSDQLGNSLVGYLNSLRSGGDNALTKGSDTAAQARNASLILDASTDQISTLRGRIGAFQKNTLDTTLNSSQIALENLTASQSTIRDTDFAQETSTMTRAQILQQAGTSTLKIANSSAQTVLSLLQ